MGNSQYRRQHYITYHGYKYSPPSIAGFIRQYGDYYLFPPPEISGGQGSERVKGAMGYFCQFQCISIFVLVARISENSTKDAH